MSEIWLHSHEVFHGADIVIIGGSSRYMRKETVASKAHQETESLYFVQAKIYREDDCLILTAKSARVRQTR
jgi:hypothetical protein